MRTLLLGFDAFDPSFFESLSNQGKARNLTLLAERNGYSRLSVANPPQSEVSWTSIATGLNPGGHGIFDFVHRDPTTYTPFLSLLPTDRGWFNQLRFVPPFKASTIFDEAIRQGFPATSLWWPATFPARQHSPVRSIPGLGTPDVKGRLGVGILLSDEDCSTAGQKTTVIRLKPAGKGVFTANLPGPARQTKSGPVESALPLRLERTGRGSVRLAVGDTNLDLQEGVWSPIIQLSFKLGRLVSVPVLTRVIISQLEPVLKLYFLPLQQHPLHSLWPYATPRRFIKEIWRACGPFLTLGWPQDTTGLEEGCITDNQFLDLCDLIFEQRRRILLYQLEHFDEGLIGGVFDTLDRVQHMFWRDRPDVIERWYLKLDVLFGEAQARMKLDEDGRSRILVLSDHGFSDFSYKVHLNRWLLDAGYLTPRDQNLHAGDLTQVDWTRTKGYAVGLNSLYLNMAGRERDGIVLSSERERLLTELTDRLLQWTGPDGRKVVGQIWDQQEAFEGPYSRHGADLVIGFNPGYRASGETGLGRWEPVSLETNRSHWGSDHCFAPDCVPGVLFSSSELRVGANPSYRDIPTLAIGKSPDQAGHGPSEPGRKAPLEDEEVMKERLRSLGYL